MNPEILMKILAWSLSDDTGTSSKVIARHLTGLPHLDFFKGHPHDPADFGRCARLLEKVPELRQNLHRMAEVSPIWRVLVTEWDNITKSMELEVGLYWEKGHSAPQTYNLMKDIIARAESA